MGGVLGYLIVVAAGVLAFVIFGRKRRGKKFILERGIAKKEKFKWQSIDTEEKA